MGEQSESSRGKASSKLPDAAQPAPKEADVQLPKQKWRPSAWQFAFGFLLVMGLGLFIAYAIWKSGVESELNAAISTAYAKGEPVWFRDLEPEPISDAQNGRELFESANAMMTTKWRQARVHFVNDSQATPIYQYLLRGGTASGRRQFFDNFYELTAADYELIREVLVETAAMRQSLAQALEYPAIQLEYDWDTSRPTHILLPMHQQSRDFNNLLSAELAVALHDGLYDEAFTVARNKLRLGRVFADEQLMVANILRISNVDNGIRGLEQLLDVTKLDDAQTRELDEILQEFESNVRLKSAILGERAMFMTTSLSVPDDLDSIAQADDLWTEFQVGAYRQLEALQMRDQIRLLETSREIAEIIDVPGEDAAQQMDRLQAKIDSLGSWHVVASMGGNFASVRRRGLITRQHIINARLGLRVARYRDMHGQLPASLDEVLDESLPSLSPGLLSGQPLVYRRLLTDGQETGFAIYDIGENMTDDGGTDDEQEQNSGFEVRDRDASQTAPEPDDAASVDG